MLEAVSAPPLNKVQVMPVDRKKDALSDIGKVLRSELARESQPPHPDIEQALRRLIEIVHAPPADLLTSATVNAEDADFLTVQNEQPAGDWFGI